MKGLLIGAAQARLPCLLRMYWVTFASTKEVPGGSMAFGLAKYHQETVT